MSTDELLHLITNGNEIKYDFIAWCVTKWHIDGISAFIERLHDDEPGQLNGIIVIKPHSVQGYLLKPDDFINRHKDHINIIYLQKNDLGIKEYVSKLRLLLPRKKIQITEGRPLYILYPKFFNAVFGAEYQFITGKTCSIIAYDEGFGSYENNFFWIFQKISYSSNFFQSMIFIFGLLYTSVVAKIHHLPMEEFFLFSKSRKGLIENQSIMRYYQKKYQNMDLQSIELSDKPFVIFFPPPMQDFEKDETEALFDCYAQIQKILAKRNLALYIKPHPREINIATYKRKGFSKIINKEYSAEDYIFALKQKPVFIIGISSTTLISIRLFFGITSVSIAAVANQYIKNPVIRKLNQNFQNAFLNVIPCISDLSDLLRFNQE